MPPALEGLRIGQLSDMHLGLLHTTQNTRWSVQQMLREQPDLIVITGDFVTLPGAIAEIGDLLRPLHAPLGVYAITGNHDYWEGIDEVRAAVEALDIHLFFNGNVRLSWQGTEFYLAGVDDMWYGAPDLDATLAGIPADAFTILLAHEPDFAENAAVRGVDVQLSGHTHGGHIHMPGLGALCLPRMGVHYAGGFEQVGPMQLYVARGLGGVPVRFNCPPEATLITLTRGEGAR
ncbi:MAG: metallophosphoesterase [Chloroflexaceae bacterium]|nr:metallophosphoesterase [Chloroflexaceae bacterium]